ncbi:non-specific serine/threonine protein kinase [Lentzea atacamensis]|uniref:Non-specific serine/threonine protein kinase n=1 Tax=Lentzea atacamensis TaxID=531938 RepID=A0ABX9E6B0_9PSEU|nr:LuxR C-terminal-related transcriptional regulator [Lentzea atacamensis]RAS64910.1 non-specific serine/threonine protein kinase [Lentzea atacamensis]
MAEQVGMCATCGAATATSRRRHARYCSNACRQRAYRQRANEPVTALDSFIGRDDELDRLTRFTDARVLTLVGPAGVGKTRLAKEFTGGRAGVEWVELASVSSQVALACATALGIGEVTREPVLSTLVHALASRTMVLVLDNCEHVAAECAALLEPLLLGCPGIRVVATSREPLRVPGEVLFPVQPLQITCAVELFADRARASQLGLRLDDRAALTTLCARLDRLPLAIELAARLVTVLPVPELLARLDDRLELLNRGNRTAAERHQSLRAAIEWSYDHLSAEEQHAFRCLSLLPGGFGLDVAVAACDLPADRVLALLSALVAKSLLTFSGAGRFEQLESVRLYGREKLADPDEVMARVAHSFAGRWPSFTSTVFSTPEVVDPLIVECATLGCAVDWAGRAGDPEHLQLATMLATAWRDQGHVSRGRALLDAAVRDSVADPAVRCLALCHLAYLAGTEHNAGVAWAEEAVTLGRELGEPVLLAQALNALAGEYVRAERNGEARKYYEEAIALLAPAADPLDLAIIEHNLAWSALRAGDVEFADALIADVLPVYRRLASPRRLSVFLHTVGVRALQRGQVDEAAESFLESLRSCRSGFWVADVLEGLALIAHGRGDPRRALRLVGAASCLREGAFADDLVWQSEVIEVVRASRVALRGVDTCLAEGREMTREQAVAYALADRAEPQELSERERQVVALVAAGRTNAGIGAELRISQRMVETHLQRVRQKLDLTTRAQIAEWAESRGAANR